MNSLVCHFMDSLFLKEDMLVKYVDVDMVISMCTFLSFHLFFFFQCMLCHVLSCVILNMQILISQLHVIQAYNNKSFHRSFLHTSFWPARITFSVFPLCLAALQDESSDFLFAYFSVWEFSGSDYNQRHIYGVQKFPTHSAGYEAHRGHLNLWE